MPEISFSSAVTEHGNSLVTRKVVILNGGEAGVKDRTKNDTSMQLAGRVCRLLCGVPVYLINVVRCRKVPHPA